MAYQYDTNASPLIKSKGEYQKQINSPQLQPMALDRARNACELARSQADPAQAPESLLPPSNNGGQTTISPPAKIAPNNVDAPHVLSSGIDTLYLAMNISWGSKTFFGKLSELKAEAKEQDKETQIVLKDDTTPNEWIFNVKPHGAKRYEWLLHNNEYTLKIGNWYKPISIPSVIAEIRSETLWSHGFQKAVNKIIDLLEGQGAFIYNVKPSRVDLCIDVLLTKKSWSIDMLQYKVTRASYTSPHFVHNKLTGISIGKGVISARLYDKPQEIKQKKDKEWMFDIWGLSEVPEEMKIIRIEFQVRREVLKKTGIEDIHDLFEKVQNLWGYCTQKWLKFQDRPGKQSIQRKTLEWWQIVQNGFLGFQAPAPLVRSVAYNEDKKQLAYQIYGLTTSYCALDLGRKEPPYEPVHIGKVIKNIMKELKQAGKNIETLNQNIESKRGKYLRTKTNKEKAKNGHLEIAYPRLAHGPRDKNKSSPREPHKKP